MKLAVAVIVPLLVTACVQDVRGLRLDEVDLSDMAEVQRLSAELAPAERPAFTTFVAIHGRSAAGNCGLTLAGREGRQPETIGEAIEAMRVRLAAIQQTSDAARPQVPATPPAPAQANGYAGPSLEEVNRHLAALER